MTLALRKHKIYDKKINELVAYGNELGLEHKKSLVALEGGLMGRQRRLIPPVAARRLTLKQSRSQLLLVRIELVSSNS